MIGYEDDLDELWSLFEQDAGRALDEAEVALLGIEDGGLSDERINQLYRGLHSIKGNARAMGLERTESFTHHAEDLVALCQTGAACLEGDVLGAVFEVVDGLRAALPSAIAERADIDDANLAAVTERIREMAQAANREGREVGTDQDFVLFDELDDDESALPNRDRGADDKPDAQPPKPIASALNNDPLIQISANRVRQLLALASDLGLAADVVVTDSGVVDAGVRSVRLAENIHRLRRLTRELRFASASLALVPISNLFVSLRRIGRDLARATGKTFDVVFKGGSTEIDRFLVDQVHDPLMHIMRNAADHGLEDSETRHLAGKPPKGVIEICASNAGQQVVIEVRDDGAGLNRDAIVKEALARGLIAPEDELSDDAICRLILAPGFSTAGSVTALSGRGMGMDAVNQSIRRLRGSLEIRSKPGRGSCFRLQLPITLTFADVLMVGIQDKSYAIPLESIRRIETPKDTDYIRSSMSQREFLKTSEGSIPVARMTENRESSASAVIILGSARGQVALPVDEVRGTEQVTLRPLNRLLQGIRGAAACGLRADGDVTVTLDCEALVAGARL